MTSNSSFNAASTGDEVVTAFADQVEGKICLITGVGPNSIGASIASSLATGNPALLILTARNPSNVEPLIAELAKSYPNVKTRYLKVDLLSLASVKSAAEEVVGYPEPSIDIVINNAGVMMVPSRQLSEDGHESHLATNYLGHWVLTNGIIPKLRASRDPRVINVSSTGYLFSPFRFTDYDFMKTDGLPDAEKPAKSLLEGYGMPYTEGYSPAVAYGQSKTALMLFAAALAKRGITSISVNPGGVDTGLWRHMPREVAEHLFTKLPMKSHSAGAATPLIAALDPKLKNGPAVYLSDCQLEEIEAFAKDEQIAERLWTTTEKMINV